MKTTTNRFNKKPLENLDNKPSEELIKIPKDVLSSWFKTLKSNSKKPRFITKDDSDKAYLDSLIDQERRNVSQLWEAFTIERGNLPRYLQDPKKQTAAYLIGFHLPNVARAVLTLLRADRRIHFSSLMRKNYKEATIVDLGCGTGALTQAWLQFIPQNFKINVSLVDTQGAFLDAAKSNVQHQRPEADVRSAKMPIEVFFDKVNFKDSDGLLVISMGYVWNEIQKNPKARTKALKWIESHMHLPMVFHIHEPANQLIARDAMEMRNFLCEIGFNPIYPCISNAPCPLLERSKDWCYTEGKFQSPQWMRKLDKYIGIDRQDIKTTAFMFVTKPVHDLIHQKKAALGLVVGRPAVKAHKKVPKNKLDYYHLLCTGSSLEKGAIIKNPSQKILRGKTVLLNERS